MDAKGPDASRASSGKTEGLWWRWSHGKSGSISSSSDGVPKTGAAIFSSAVAAGGAGSNNGGYGEPFSPSVANKHNSSSNNHSFSCSSVTHSVSPAEKARRQPRNIRGGGLTTPPREEIGPAAFSARDSWIPALSLGVASSGSASAAPKFFSPSPRSLSRRSSAPAKKKSATPQGSSRASAYARPAAARKTSSFAASSSAYVDISWSAGNSTKRKVSKKDKKSGRTAVMQPSYRTPASRTSMGSYDENQDEEMYSSAFAMKTSWKSPTVSNSSSGSDRSRSTSNPPLQTSKSPFGKVGATPLSSTSTASSGSTSSSIGLPVFSNSRSDPVVDCARAVLQDCIRQRHMGFNNARKRAIDGYDGLESKRNPWQYATVSKKTDWSMMSSGSSSGSDEELSQLSSRDHFMCDDKYDRNSGEAKLSSEEYLRQAMLQGCALSSSPELECFSPLYEEKGLSVEIRYQLPIALGTADETDKQCTICQIRYGIGDHIVTLPCQHFFHACCVDKWLWNHTSCPLCRTEVSLESDAETSGAKPHKFSECSETDQNRLRRQMRSTSHTAGFKPVIPVEEEVAELESSITTMNIDDEETSSDEENAYLVCPTPQRPRAG